MSEVINQEMETEITEDVVDIEFVPPNFKEMQKDITSYIKQLREDKNLTQTEVASQIGITQNGYAKLERGETKDLAVSRLLSISKVFNIDVTDLFPNTHDKKIGYVGNNSNSVHGTNVHSTYYGSADDGLVIENEKLKLELDYQKQLYEQQAKQIELMERLLEKGK